MTQSTEQERAEFEKWWSSPHIWGRGHKEAQWASWQAARRAQVVPPCNTKESEAAIEASMAERDYPCNPMNAARAGWEACRSFAAAPQPPEGRVDDQKPAKMIDKAAPVQMPDPAVPFAVFDCHGFYAEKPNAKQAQAFCDHYNKRDADGGGSAPYTVQALYTEQQVQHLLAAQKFQMDELAMLTRKLVQSLRKAALDNESAEKALDYLKRKGLGGNPLRDTQG